MKTILWGLLLVNISLAQSSLIDVKYFEKTNAQLDKLFNKLKEHYDSFSSENFLKFADELNNTVRSIEGVQDILDYVILIGMVEDKIPENKKEWFNELKTEKLLNAVNTINYEKEYLKLKMKFLKSKKTKSIAEDGLKIIEECLQELNKITLVL